VITTWASLDRNGYTPEFRITKKAPKLFQAEKLNNALEPKKKLKTSLWISPKTGLMRSSRTQRQASLKSSLNAES
jgi:hypothetical protein